MKVVFGKYESYYLKGIAIVMMFYHHLFGFSSFIKEDNYFVSTVIGGYNIELILATFCKLCVGIFAFTTGYAMFVQKEKYDLFKNRMKKVLQFLVHYWIIYFIFIIIGMIFNEPLPSLKRMILQCFGITTGTGFDWKYQSTIHPIFAWYVSFYCLFMIVYPFLKKLCRFNFIADNIILFVVLNGIYIAVLKQPYFECHKVILDILSRFALWGHISMMGYLFAKYNILDLVNKMTHKIRPMILFSISIVIVMIMIVLRWKFGSVIKYSFSYDVLYTPILICSLLVIVNCIHFKPLKICLIELSRCSTSMWFLHALYFTPLSTFQWMAYCFKSPIIILITTLISMYVFSRVIDWVVRKIQRKICC